MAEQLLEEAVNKCMSFIPDEMDKNEGRNLMTLLYKIGFLSGYLDTLDDADEIGLCLDEHDKKREFSHCFDFKKKNNITIDPQTGRIKFLDLCRIDCLGTDMDFYISFDLPSMIEQFDMLESIKLWNCHLIPIELGNLSQLKAIGFYECHKNLLENIPEILQLPSSTKRVSISFPYSDSILDSDSDSYSSLVPFMKILPDALEELCFGYATREQADEILRILEKDELIFSQSLTTLGMHGCKLNEDDFELLLFEIRSNFPNLRTLAVWDNEIKSLLGIEARIKRMSSSSSSSLTPQNKLPNNDNMCKIDIGYNPVFSDVIMKKTASIDPKEKAAMLTFLNTFDRISNLGLNPYHSNPYVSEDEMYNPDIEYLLRRNKVNMKYTTTTTTTTTEEGNISGGNENTTIINQSLWPLMFERAYKNSHEIYDSDPVTTQEKKNGKICATGLFELLRHGPFFTESRQRRCYDDTKQKKTTTTTTTTTNHGNGKGNNNTTLKRKRSTHSS